MRCYLVATVLSYLLLHCLCNDIVKAEYDKLAQQYAHIFVVSSVSNLLEWDRQVLMPEKAAELRAKQEAVIQGFTHDFRIQPWINE
jgi:Zn-dependent M32 family carboxypeptidase